MSTRDRWLAKLAKLHINRSRPDPAPHKPLLLLSVLALVDDVGPLPAVLPLTPELAFRFQTLAGVVAHRRSQRPDVRFPFHHLEYDGVWSPLTADGKPSTDYRSTKVVAVNQDFAAFVAEAANRDAAKRVLIRAYFSQSEQVALVEMLNLTDLEGGLRGAAPALIEAAVQQGRDGRFRLRVVAAYNYTCALTGYRLTTVEGATVVDAAHIHRFADSGNNDPRNGLALCKNAHWMFDEGLWTLSDACEVIVAAGMLSETGPEDMRLAPYHGRPLAVVPAEPSARPDPVHLAWHRRHAYAADDFRT